MRTSKGEEKYREYKAKGGLDGGCRLCEAPALQSFTYWKIVENKFPYDAVASKHDMIVPLAHQNINKIPQEAWWELSQLKETFISEHYDFMIEATKRRLSIPAHFHLHLTVMRHDL
jgi:hypothetical protein